MNMTYAGGQVQWGNANRDDGLTVDLEQLMQMARFDCEITVYTFRGRVNRRKFGVPMGGFMSPGLAVIALSMVELASCNQHGTWTRSDRRYGSLHG